MKLEDTLAEQQEVKYELLPSLSIDCVIFGFHDNLLKILLLRFRNTEFWALPGGFIRKDEDVDEAACRVLEERAGVRDIFLEQFHTFGEQDRVDISIHQKIMEAAGKKYHENHWLFKRYVSVGYYALVDFSKVISSPDSLSDACEWFDINEMPDLVFDHGKIVQKALENIRMQLDHKVVGFNLLPETFTMAELQSLHETILGKKLLRTNFQRKMLGLGILERLEKKYSGGAHKAPFLYRFETGK